MNSYDPERLSRMIIDLAAKAGSQRRLADCAGLDPKTIRNAINSTHGMTLMTACAIADGAGITVAELIGEPPRINQDIRALVTRLMTLVEQTEDAPARCPTDAPPSRQRRPSGTPR